MPYGDPDPEDPMMLVGVGVPADRLALTDMAYAFAEEFARMGYDAKQVLGLFRRSFFAGPHRAYRALGERRTMEIIEECVGTWGRMRLVERDPAPRAGAGGRQEGEHD